MHVFFFFTLFDFFFPDKLWQLVIDEFYLQLVCVGSILQHAEVHGAACDLHAVVSVGYWVFYVGIQPK